VLCLVTLKCFFLFRYLFTYLFKIKYFHDLEFSESCDFNSRSIKVPSFYISPITGPRCPEGSRKLRFPDYVTVAQVGDKIVSLTHRPLFTPRKYSLYSRLLEAESTPGP